MQEREYKKVTITNKGEISVLNGHPWIYNGEIVKKDEIVNGELVDVISLKDKYLGTGFYNDNSKITIRLLSRNANDKFDYDFFKRRVKYAWDYRKSVMPNDLNCIRVIYGEADGFPGLTVDKFNNVLVCQILSLGIDVRKNDILKALYEVLTEDGEDIIGIYEREDAPIRELEGLEQFKGWYDLGLSIPNKTTTEIIENGIKYLVDFENGQKTGFFLDQKYNRLLVKNLAKGHNVLDCCTHTGSFAMNAYLGGALKVKATDISEKAITDAKSNFEMNNMKIDTEVADVFDTLKRLADSKTKEFDFIIVDPPAFTKSRKTIGNAMKGYEELNYLAMKSLPRGGYLITASCSHFATEELFKRSIMDAALHAGVSLKQVEISGAAPDHPVLWGVPETEYLHFIILQVV